MGRALGAFFLLFSLLSLIVHLPGTFLAFGIAGVAIVAIESLLDRLPKSSRAGSVPREPLL